MRLRTGNRRSDKGSTLVIVLWIAIGLVSLTLYFAQSMLYEIKAADHRVEGLAAEQAVDAGARYAIAIISSLETNGMVPGIGSYAHAAVPLSPRALTAFTDHTSAKFWFIGRDTNAEPVSRSVTFGLVDEASKINLNSATSNMLFYLCDMDVQLTEAILDWRGSNSPGSTYVFYGMQDPPYECKQAPFETVGELGLVMGVTPELLYGEDRNRNGVLDPDETDLDRDGRARPGLLGLATVFSREPNTYSNGTERVNIRMVTTATQGLREILENNLDSGRADAVLQRLGLSGGGGGGGGGQTPVSFTSPLQFFRRSGMTLEEFELISDQITVVEGEYIDGRVNINTASSEVLSCLPGLAESPDLVMMMIDYRLSNPDRLSSVAWLVEAVGDNNEEVLARLERQDCITTRSYQFNADVAATGAFGRGYRRSQFVIDSSTGYPKVVYRQDLTHLGWALGKEIRDQMNSLTQNGNIASR
jgi:DNA uptake protein ComE-like DNA-binding protein